MEYFGKIKVIKHKEHLELVQSRQRWLNSPIFTKKDAIDKETNRILNQMYNDSRDKEVLKRLAEDNKRRSLYRTKGAIFDLIVNNNFNYWLTLTFDKSKYDSNNRDFVINAFRDLRRWFNSSDIKYVAVLEKHEKSGFHIHLIIEAPSTFHNDYWSRALNRKVGSSSFGKIIKGKYDSFVKWSYGYSNLIKVDNSYESIFKIANYMRKYMTKSLFDELGRKRYWSSKGLKRPKVLAVLDPTALEGVKFDNESINYRRTIYRVPTSINESTYYEDIEHLPHELLFLLIEEQDKAPPEV